MVDLRKIAQTISFGRFGNKSTIYDRLDEYDFENDAEIKVIKEPIGLETFLKSEDGKHFLDVVKEYLDISQEIDNNLCLSTRLYNDLTKTLNEKQISDLFKILNSLNGNGVEDSEIDEEDDLTWAEIEKEESLKKFPYETRFYTVLANRIAKMYGLDKTPLVTIEKFGGAGGFAMMDGSIVLNKLPSFLKGKNSMQKCKFYGVEGIFHEMTHIKQYADIAHIFKNCAKLKDNNIVVGFDEDYFRALPAHFKLMFYSSLVWGQKYVIEGEKGMRVNENDNDYWYAYQEVDARIAGTCGNLYCLDMLREDLNLNSKQMNEEKIDSFARLGINNTAKYPIYKETFIKFFKDYWTNNLVCDRLNFEMPENKELNILDFCGYIASIISQKDIEEVSMRIWDQLSKKEYEPLSVLPYDSKKVGIKPIKMPEKTPMVTKRKVSMNGKVEEQFIEV